MNFYSKIAQILNIYTFIHHYGPVLVLRECCYAIFMHGNNSTNSYREYRLSKCCSHHEYIPNQGTPKDIIKLLEAIERSKSKIYEVIPTFSLSLQDWPAFCRPGYTTLVTDHVSLPFQRPRTSGWRMNLDSHQPVNNA